MLPFKPYRLRLTSILGITLGLVGWSMPQAVAQDGPRPLDPVIEQVLSEIPVSASGLIHGVMYGEPVSPPAPEALRVALTAPSGVLCVTIKSQDARYLARRGFDLAGVQPGTYPLDMGLSEANELRRYERDEAAVVAVLGRRCPDYDLPPTFVPTVWSKAENIPASDLSKVTLFVAAGENDAYIVFTRRNGDQDFVECQRVENDRARTAYNKTCRIDLNAADAGETFTLVQSYFGDFRQQSPFRLMVGR